MAWPYSAPTTVTDGVDDLTAALWNASVVTPLTEILAILGTNPEGTTGSLEARIDVEHNDDGTHAAITATSLAATGNVTAGGNAVITGTIQSGSGGTGSVGIGTAATATERIIILCANSETPIRINTQGAGYYAIVDVNNDFTNTLDIIAAVATVEYHVLQVQSGVTTVRAAQASAATLALSTLATFNSAVEAASFTSYKAASTNYWLFGYVTGDTQARIAARADGLLLWGSGSVAGDTNLYRSAADTLKTDDNFIVNGKLALDPGAGLTIASGVITVTAGLHFVDTEGAAATDDVDTINGGIDGMLLVLRPNSSTRDVVLKDGTGNLNLAGDFTLNNTQDSITLMFYGTTWVELSRSDNGA